ncbi:MAG: hypothetical protein ABIU07_17610, partial [Ramlibacter sp.]
MGLANIALAAALAISFKYRVGSSAVSLLFSESLLRTVGGLGTGYLSAFASLFVLPVIIYLVLRLVGAEVWMKSRPGIQRLLAVGNVVCLLYALARAFAAGIEGGGASFVVMTLGVYALIPALVMLLIGGVWLLVNSVRNRGGAALRSRFVPSEGGVLLLVLAAPVFYTSNLFVGEKAPFRVATTAMRTFQDRCKSAGEKIQAKPAQEVTGVYLERDGGLRLDGVQNGSYRSRSSG